MSQPNAITSFAWLRELGLVVTLLASSTLVSAQKNIVISDSLSANSEQLSIKMPTQGVGKIKVEFGEYRVVSGKAGWTTSATKARLFTTRSETNSKAKFSFVLVNGNNDSASVDAIKYVKTTERHAIRLTPHFSLGNDELQKWSENFTAIITVKGDTSNTWALLMNGSGTIDTAARYEEYLVTGDRKVLLSPVTSNKNNDDKRTLPAFGYEFSEGGRAVSALQYYGGGLLGRNRIFVWIDKRLEAKTKLVLSAAMTAVLQLRASEL